MGFVTGQRISVWFANNSRSTVTLLAHEGDEVFQLDDKQETMLLAAIAEAERGEVTSAAEILQKLRSS